MGSTETDEVARLRAALAQADRLVDDAERAAWADGEPTLDQRVEVADFKRARRRARNALDRALGAAALRRERASGGDR